MKPLILLLIAAFAPGATVFINAIMMLPKAANASADLSRGTEAFSHHRKLLPPPANGT